jgi:hypothetical protein
MAKTKFDKMFPTKKQNVQTGNKAALDHRDTLKSGKNIYGNKTARLSESYRKRKQRKVPGSPDNSDFFLSGKMYKSFAVDKRSTSSNKIIYKFITYLPKKDLPRGLSSRHKASTRGAYVYAKDSGKRRIPKSTEKILVNDFTNNTKGNLRKLLRNKKPFKINLTIV